MGNKVAPLATVERDDLGPDPVREETALDRQNTHPETAQGHTRETNLAKLCTFGGF